MTAMSTDVSLLMTRTVAQQTLDVLGLSMTPEALLGTVTPVPTGSPEILQVTMSGPSDAEAVHRLAVLSSTYLAFRYTKLSAQSQALITGFKKQLDELTARLNKDDAKLQALETGGESATDRGRDLIAERSRLTEQINNLEGRIQQAQQQQSAIRLASMPIDPPVPATHGRLRGTALALASGLIGGVALGLGSIVLPAILSDRLWLRVEVASALEAAVPLSVRRLAPLRGPLCRLSFLPPVRKREARRALDRRLLAGVAKHALPEAGRRQSLALLGLDNSHDLRFGAVEAARLLRSEGRPAILIDLTSDGGLAAAVERLALSGDDKPEVFRPNVVPSLAKGPADLEIADWDDVALAKVRTGTALILADLDPAVGVDHLVAWTDRVVVAVTAGRSSVELVRTAGDLVRSADLQLQCAVLLNAARDDTSSGLLAHAAANPGDPRSRSAPPDDPTQRFVLP